MPELSDAELVDKFAALRIERDAAGFYRGWLARELRIQRCGDCGRWHHPPRPMCPSCWSWNVAPTRVSGRGTVHLRMLLHQGPPSPGVDYEKGPHPVVVVELAEQKQLRITSTMVGCTPEQIAIGMPVELDWVERWGAPFPVFRPASHGQGPVARSEPQASGGGASHGQGPVARSEPQASGAPGRGAR